MKGELFNSREGTFLIDELRVMYYNNLFQVITGCDTGCGCDTCLLRDDSVTTCDYLKHIVVIDNSNFLV